MAFLYNLKNRIKVTKIGNLLLETMRKHKEESIENINEAIHYAGLEDLGEEEKKKLISTLRECNKKYGISYRDYFSFDFANKTEEERKEFIPDREHRYILRKINDPSKQYIFDDKYETSKVFHEFFKRECIRIESSKDTEPLSSFLMKHKEVIVKPLSSGGGARIQKFTLLDYDSKDLAKSIIEKYCDGKMKFGIVEEVIDQDDRMAALHKESLNTIRMTTFLLDNETVLFHPFVRIGTGNSIVDNASSGGISCMLDEKTGRIIRCNILPQRNITRHPDTNVELINFEIPHWSEAIEFVKRMAKVVPENRYVGWDIALSKNGWVLVEANARGQFEAMQATLNKGVRKEVEEYLKRIK